MLRGFIKPIAVGILVGAAVCLAILLALALAATIVDIPPAAVVPLATLATAMAAFICGMTSAKISGRNGWLIGSLSSIILFIMSVLAGLGFYKETEWSFILVKLLIMFACGLVGGILAVNSGKHKKR